MLDGLFGTSCAFNNACAKADFACQVINSERDRKEVRSAGSIEDA
jgi:hypothetical protein